MRIVPVPCLSDNYAYLVVCLETKQTAIVDASEAEPVAKAIDTLNDELRTKLSIAAIWSTHHHWDHVGGNEELGRRLGIADVYGHTSDDGRLPGLTKKLDDGDTFTLGKLAVRARHIPGHTTGAVAYVVSREPNDPAVFTGDTLFVAGCGRLFEGTPAMMHASLEKLAALDQRARVYCGHEYTLSNLRFAHHVEPQNPAIARAKERAERARAEGKPTVPSTVGQELQHNPFMRVDSPEIRRTLGIDPAASSADALGAIRKAKDEFK
jgi:hydroxyacylglutathione hydrolase